MQSPMTFRFDSAPLCSPGYLVPIVFKCEALLFTQFRVTSESQPPLYLKATLSYHLEDSVHVITAVDSFFFEVVPYPLNVPCQGYIPLDFVLPFVRDILASFMKLAVILQTTRAANPQN